MDVIKIGIVSLGCAKNLVDSELILGMFKKGNFAIVQKPEDADVIIVNTCGFIDSSKEESIKTILEMAKYNKRLVVVGCLVERYLDELKKAIPEVDLFVPIRDYSKLHVLIEKLMHTKKITKFNPLNRVISTQPFTAYLRISEGCNNCCTYCAIPLIRGSFKSRPLEEIEIEATELEKNGVKEIVVISQDTTRYGTDIKDKNINICDLLKMLLNHKGFLYIRLLYLYPDEISDELLYLIGSEPRLTPYFDIPIQHSSTKVLESMHRRGNHDFLVDLFNNRVRKVVPNAILRTTFIVGFPGETDEDFNNLLDFVDLIKFDHLGAFTYSREEGTVSYDYKNQIDEDTKIERYEKLMKKQKVISYQKNKSHIGEVMEGLVVGYDNKNDLYLLRSGWNAPDDIDGKITFKSHRKLALGEQVKVKITNAFVYDLDGILVD